MECQQRDRMLYLRQKGNTETDDGIRQEIEQHLKSCPSCRGELWLEAMEERVLQEKTPIPPLSPDFIQRTMQLLPPNLYGTDTKAAAGKSKERKRFLFPRIFLGAAASVLLLLGGGFYLKQNLSDFSQPEHIAENTAVKTTVQEKTTSEEAAELLPAIEEEDTGELPSLTPDRQTAEMASPVPEPTEPVGRSAWTGAGQSTPVYEYSSPIKEQPIVLADAEMKEEFPRTNPYQNYPASTYESAAETYYETSRSISGLENARPLAPLVVLSSIPDEFRLAGFSHEEGSCRFNYQNDTRQIQLLFTVAPYSSSEEEGGQEPLPATSRLVQCGDRTYQIQLEGNMSEDDMTAILNFVALSESEQETVPLHDPIQ